ncbi:MAG: SpoIID/LytB domain-containing protein, partial [Oscillospiraceae bacterium]|nr:SpoIID/LytB domain-containing protein [Oscillospiraceae bacterium]
MKRISKLLAFALAVALLFGLVPAVETVPAAQAFTPAHDVIRIGLNAPSWSWSMPPSLILANSGGLRIGTFNAARELVPLPIAAHSRMTITATGTTVTIRNAAGATLHSGTGAIAIGPVSDHITTTYTVPHIRYAGNLRTSFEFRGGFRFTASGGRLTIVNYVDLEDYIKGIIPFEMPAGWPIEALKAQAVTARTFAVRSFGRRASAGFDLSNTVWCQVYRGTQGTTAHTDRAVTETRGQFILHNGRPIEAVYHSTSGGATEDVENVWGSSVAYLRGVEDPHSILPSVQWTRTLTPAELRNHVRSRNSAFTLPDIADVIMEYTPLGNVLSMTFVAS